jgi:E2/UBC family protein E
VRRQFALPSFDIAYLDSTGLAWETIVDTGGTKWLLVHGRRVPSGYTAQTVTVALMIAPGYPEAQLDMAYFHPPLGRTDGRAVGALSWQDIDGCTFQRWSRHRTAAAPWRPGEDDVSSHLVLVDDWLERELTKP